MIFLTTITRSLAFFACLSYSFIFSQQVPDIGDSNSHEYFIDQLNKSKDENFQNTIERYNAYISQYPENIIAQIELCKFIGGSYWDAYEDYNLKYDETEDCIVSLYESYPFNPKVIIYRAESLYGDELQEILTKAEEQITSNNFEWSDEEIARIYQMLGNNHSEDNELSLTYYLKAQSLDESLDISLKIAKAYIAQNNRENAKKVLIRDLEKDTLTWVMNQKADLLLELKEHEKALHLYHVIASKDSTFLNNGDMATAMSELGDLKTARAFLVKDTLQEWNKTKNAQSLFKFDLEHSDADTALSTYRNLQKLDSNDDFFGIKRLRLFFKSPLLTWKITEIFHVFLFALSIVLILIIPYLWVLPVHSFGIFLKNRKKPPVPKLNFNWNLKQFWLISFMYLLVSYLLLIVFGYTENINYYLEVATSYTNELEDSIDLANQMVFFVIGLAISILLVLKKSNLKHILHSNVPFFKILGLSIGLVILNMITLRILGSFIDLTTNETTGIF